MEYEDTDKTNDISMRDYRQLIVEIRKANLHFQQMCSIPSGELAMLLAIHRLSEKEEPIIASDLGRALELSRPAVSRMLHILEKKGYIQMVCGLEDHRYVVIQFTEAGRKLMQDEMEGCLNLLKRVACRMGEKDMHEFLYYSSRFCGILADEISL